MHLLRALNALNCSEPLLRETYSHGKLTTQNFRTKNLHLRFRTETYDRPISNMKTELKREVVDGRDRSGYDFL